MAACNTGEALGISLLDSRSITSVCIDQLEPSVLNVAFPWVAKYTQAKQSKHWTSDVHCAADLGSPV